jgi:hypothetical protein
MPNFKAATSCRSTTGVLAHARSVKVGRAATLSSKTADPSRRISPRIPSISSIGATIQTK